MMWKITFFAILLIGWVANIVGILAAFSSALSLAVILAVLGVPGIPLGIVMGWLHIFGVW